MNQKILIISDTHLTPKFNKNKYKELKILFTKFDKIILNGDILDNFWNYKKTINSKWSELFKILKTKETIYIYGNHDPKSPQLLDQITKFTKHQTSNYTLKIQDKELIIFHGDQICPMPTNYLNKKSTNNRQKTLKFLLQKWRLIGYPLALTYMKISQKYPNTLGKSYINSIKKENNKMKEYGLNKFTKNQILICGHSHYSQIDLKNNFINSGANCYNKLQYITIINNKIKLETKKLN